MGHAELRAEGSDYDEQSSSSKRASERNSRNESPVDLYADPPPPPGN